MQWQDIAAIVIGAAVVIVALIAHLWDRKDRHHHHRIRFGIFIERNGDNPDDEDR